MELDFSKHELAVIRQALNNALDGNINLKAHNALESLRKALSDCEKAGTTLHINTRSN